MKYKYLEKESKEAIDDAKKEKVFIVMMVDGYLTDEEALMLRDFLWYARNKGVEVRLIPKENKLKVNK